MARGPGVTELPSGTVTLLFTDIEGSTRLLQRLGDRYADALEVHRRLLRATFERWGGREVDSQGDAFFVAFGRATDAAAAAVQGQRALASHPWPEDAEVRVRMGLHAGEPMPLGEGYIGMDVHRAARICAAGHGGQVLLSEAAAALVQGGLPEGLGLRDLGAHRLKDLRDPERLFQLVAPDLPTEFPPPKTLDARPHNLPIQPTPLIGRHHEVESLRGLLLREDVRLVTLTGPGGIGKTRLGLAVAAELIEAHDDGVFLVELAPISDPALVLPTIALTLGVGGSARPIEELKQFLRDRKLLLLLDNFEQVLDAATIISDLLATSAGLKILVTSRAALRLRAEHELAIPPLATPDPGTLPPLDELHRYGAVTMFVERARAVRPDFTLTPENSGAVATICARLDGLPLALELAAARTRLLSPEAMAGRIEHRLPLLTGGPRDLPSRQRTLRDAIAWSYDLLEPAEQRAFRGLAIFVGGFTLDAAEAVLGTSECQIAGPVGGEDPDVLSLVEQLVARSLVRRAGEAAGEPRFGMLETIREFGLELLEANRETARVGEAHLRWCVELARRAEPHLRGADSARWLDRFEDEHDNFRAAFRWAERSGDPAGLGLELASLLGHTFWTPRGHHHEGRDWLGRLLPYAPPRSLARARALSVVGNLAQRQHDYSAASAELGEALEIFRELGDCRGVATTLRRLAVVPHHLEQHDTAQAMLEEALAIAREIGDPETEIIALQYLADLAHDRGDHARAAMTYAEGLTLARQQEDTHNVAYVLRGLGNVARAQGQYARAEERFRESLALLKPLRDRRCIPICLEGLACITVGPNWADRAARLLGAAHAVQARTGAPSPPSAMADYRRTVADARRLLGAERFDAAWAAGAAIDLDAAVDLALATPLQRDALAEAEQPAASHAARPLDIPLSPREREVVGLIARGLSNREISEQLVLSVRTVERHIENVYNRLGISGKAGRAIVTAYALRQRLIESA